MEPAPEFSVTRRRAGDAVVVAPVGEIDLATVDELAQALDAAREEAAERRARPARGDVHGLRRPAARARGLARAARAFAVVRGPREVQRVFDLVGLDERRLTMLDQPPDG